MYLFKNAWRNIIRSKGRNILIGIIITVITISGCIALSIHKSGTTLVENYKEENLLEVSFQLDPMALRDASTEEKEAFNSLDVEQVLKLGESSFVSEYYYTLETSLESSSVTAVNYNEMKMNEEEINDHGSRKSEFGNMGSFRLTAYSDFSYLDDFLSGTKKIISGKMIDRDSTDEEIVISEDLATENELELGDTVTFYLPTDESVSYRFTIVGIYEDNSNIEENSFMAMNVMNSRNQLYTNLDTINEILANEETNSDTTTKQMMSKNGLTAKFYLQNNLEETIDGFEQEAREKGLSNYYSLTTNEEALLETLKPIQNLSDYSLTFLIVILIVGALILFVINMINIRERKYEIGVLRAIGMNKKKVTLQLVLEIAIVSMISLILGTGIGTILSQPVTNQMLNSEIASYQEKLTNQQQNFGEGNFSRPQRGNQNSFERMMNSTNYIDSLTVSIDLGIVVQLFLVSLLLTIVSGSIAIMFVNQYEPNKILQNRT